MKKKISLILLSIVQVVANAMVMINSTKEAKLFLSTLKEGMTGMPEETIKQVTEVFTLDFAKSFIVKSLEEKKSVVTANKEVIAKDIDSLILNKKNKEKIIMMKK